MSNRFYILDNRVKTISLIKTKLDSLGEVDDVYNGYGDLDKKLRNVRILHLRRCLDLLEKGSKLQENKDYFDALISILYRPILPSLNKETLQKFHTEDGKRWPEFVNIEKITELSQSVGIVNKGNDPISNFLATGFLLDEGLFLTNYHPFAQNSIAWRDDESEKGHLSREVTLSVEYDEFMIEVKEILYMAHPKSLDIALLKLKNKDFEDEDFEDEDFEDEDFEDCDDNRKLIPLQLHKKPISNDQLKGRKICMVGFPAAKTNSISTTLTDINIHGRSFMLGRLHPTNPLLERSGKQVLQHDCSSAIQANGSCIFDLDDGEDYGKVLGIQYFGSQGKTNYAIPSWTIWENIKRFMKEELEHY